MKEKTSRLLTFLYTTSVGNRLLRILVSPAVSKAAGKVMNSRLSLIAVSGFIKSQNIDVSEFEKTSFSSYNDFFTRKLKPDARLLAQGDDILISPCDAKLTIPDEEEVLVSPCDCKATVYKIQEDSIFSVKNTEYTLRSLLKSVKLARRFQGGYCYILRLTVDDYHRYIYPVSGRRSHERTINGVFHTVQPIALEHCPVYKENTRKYCIIKTKEFGTILMMEVGAMMVGRITNHEAEPGYVTRGEEKGYFEFGGSTIILLTQKGAVLPRKNILHRSARGEETCIRQGEKIGKVNNNQR